MKDAISRTSGVGDVQLFGSQYAMRIWMNPNELNKFQLTPVDVITAIKAQNAQVAAWFVEAKLKQGIESATQKKIVKMIKDSKLKVQAQIQGDEIRVTGKSRDDLQAVMAMVRGGDLGQPFQFKNFRD